MIMPPFGNIRLSRSNTLAFLLNLYRVLYGILDYVNFGAANVRRTYLYDAIGSGMNIHTYFFALLWMFFAVYCDVSMFWCPPISWACNVLLIFSRNFVDTFNFLRFILIVELRAFAGPFSRN